VVASGGVVPGRDEDVLVRHADHLRRAGTNLSLVRGNGCRYGFIQDGDGG
jgi:hypothetical protein